MRRPIIRRRYSSLVVKRGDEMRRTPFTYGDILIDVVNVARAHGWTPVAYVYMTWDQLKKWKGKPGYKRENGLQEVG